MLTTFEKEREMIEEEVIDLSYFMKGGLTYSEAWQTTRLQRATLAKRIQKHNADSGGKDYM